MKIPISVEILTLNSGKTIGKCLESVKDFDDIIILDGNSTDDTLEIARKYGARIFPQKETQEKNVRIEDFSEVRNKGLKLAKYQWFTFLDSDEYLSEEASHEMSKIAKGQGSEIKFWRRPRKFILNGQVVERATTYPNYQLRFFYIMATVGFVKKVHECVKLPLGAKVGDLQCPEYVPLPTVLVAKRKYERYLDIQQEALKNLTFKRLVNGLWSNLVKIIKFILKFLYVRVFKKGNPLPFPYEFHNVTYHVRLMNRLVINYYLKLKRN